MMECKNALTETGGDVSAAKELLLERGIRIAEQKEERVAAEGMAYAAVINGKAVLLEVNSETDFVSGNEKFRENVRKIAEVIARYAPADIDELAECKSTNPENTTIREMLNMMSLAFKEKIVIRRFNPLEGPMVTAYTHGGGQYAVILSLDADDQTGKNLAMHIAASAPLYVSREKISSQEHAVIREKITSDMEDDMDIWSKPDKIKDKILEGRIEKYYRKNCLMEQPYVKDPEITVRQYLKNMEGETAIKLNVFDFCRYEKGEGLISDGTQDNMEYAKELSNSEG